MTFREKQQAVLVDLLAERAATDPSNAIWLMRLDDKIGDMWEAIYGSGTGIESGGNTGVSHVSGGASQVVRESGDASGAVSV